MNFDELDRRLRVFETAHDHCALPGLYLVARLDGRGFGQLVAPQSKAWRVCNVSAAMLGCHSASKRC
jgi:hypothetical protein